MINSKQKGASFERLICKALSLWVSNNKREDLFWRSAMSGGRATVGRKRDLDLCHQAGDITAVHPEGHVLTDNFYFECKHLKKFTLDCLVTGAAGRDTLPSIWNKTCAEAFHYRRTPVLIAKQNGWPVLFITALSGVEDLYLPEKYQRVYARAYGASGLSMYIFLFSDVVTKCKPPKAIRSSTTRGKPASTTDL